MAEESLVEILVHFLCRIDSVDLGEIVQREDRTPKLNRIAKTAKIKREQYAYLFYFLQGSKVTGENSTLIYFSRVA